METEVILKMADSMDSRKQNRACSKLRSEKGASITFALLLFLVCAVLSAVVLAAATTAAGRMSNIAETDQRYYSVVSSAELVSEVARGTTVSVFKFEGDSDYYTFMKPAEEVSEADFFGASASLPETDPSAEEMVRDTSSKPVIDVAAGSASIIGELARIAVGGKDSAGWNIRSTSASAELSEDPLAVTVNGGRKAGNNVYLDVFNTAGSPYNNNKYRPFTLRVEFRTRAEELTGDRLKSVIKKLNVSGTEKNVEKVWNVSFGTASIKPPTGTD